MTSVVADWSYLLFMEREGESKLFGSWLGSQTAAIKSSGRGNVFLKLWAHILVVGHMQFLCMAPTLAACPSWWRNMFVMKRRSVFSSKGQWRNRVIQADLIPAEGHFWMIVNIWTLIDFNGTTELYCSYSGSEWSLKILEWLECITAYKSQTVNAIIMSSAECSDIWIEFVLYTALVQWIDLHI